MTEAQTTLHLTLTGPSAGRPFCDVNKAEAMARGERFGHVPYSRLDEFFALPFLCPKCKAEWDAAGTDE
jgi:hypothetical protein